MSYNMTWTGNATNILVLVQNVNTNLDGLPAVFLLVLTFIISLSANKSRDFIESWNISSFITLTIAALLWFASLITWEYTLVPLSLLIIGLGIYFVRGGN